MSLSERDCLRHCVTLRRDLSSYRARCLRRSYVLAMTLTWSVVGRRFARSAAEGGGTANGLRQTERDCEKTAKRLRMRLRMPKRVHSAKSLRIRSLA